MGDVSADRSQLCSRVAFATLDFATLSFFEIHIPFHSIAMVDKAIESKAPKCCRLYLIEAFMEYTVQKIFRSRMDFAGAANLALLENLVPFHFFSYLKDNFLVFIKLEKGHTSR